MLTLVMFLTIGTSSARSEHGDMSAMLQGSVASKGHELGESAGTSDLSTLTRLVQNAHYGLSSIEYEAANLWTVSQRVKKDLMLIARLEGEEDEHLPVMLRKVGDALHTSMDSWTRLREAIEDSTSNITATMVRAGQGKAALKMKAASDDAVGPVRSFIMTMQEARDQAHSGQRRTKRMGSPDAQHAMEKIRELNGVLRRGFTQLRGFGPKFQEAFQFLATAEHHPFNVGANPPGGVTALLAVDAQISDAREALTVTSMAAREVSDSVTRSAKVLVGGVKVATHFVAPETLVETNDRAYHSAGARAWPGSLLALLALVLAATGGL